MNTHVRQEAATRHHPIAYARDPRVQKPAAEPPKRRTSHVRLQAAVGVQTRDDNDPQADMPCTD